MQDELDWEPGERIKAQIEAVKAVKERKNMRKVASKAQAVAEGAQAALEQSERVQMYLIEVGV